MVVSEITDRLSPNMPPPMTAAMATPAERSASSAMPRAMGPMAAMVPMDVPVASPRADEITKTPANTNCRGMMDSPKFTAASVPPMASAAPEKAPARAKIMIISMTPGSPQCLATRSMFRSMFLRLRLSRITVVRPHSTANSREICLNGFSVPIRENTTPAPRYTARNVSSGIKDFKPQFLFCSIMRLISPFHL